MSRALAFLGRRVFVHFEVGRRRHFSSEREAGSRLSLCYLFIFPWSSRSRRCRTLGEADGKRKCEIGEEGMLRSAEQRAVFHRVARTAATPARLPLSVSPTPCSAANATADRFSQSETIGPHSQKSIRVYAGVVWRYRTGAGPNRDRKLNVISKAAGQ